MVPEYWGYRFTPDNRGSEKVADWLRYPEIEIRVYHPNQFQGKRPGHFTASGVRLIGESVVPDSWRVDLTADLVTVNFGGRTESFMIGSQWQELVTYGHARLQLIDGNPIKCLAGVDNPDIGLRKLRKNKQLFVIGEGESERVRVLFKADRWPDLFIEDNERLISDCSGLVVKIVGQAVVSPENIERLVEFRAELGRIRARNLK